MKIYTRSGDAGETGLYGGQRVPKDDIRVEACGTLDELNAALGMAAALANDNQVHESITTLQHDLFAAGWDLATPITADVPRLNGSCAMRLETEIDTYEAELPPLRNFILPGGNPSSAALHQARCVCRRAERRVVALMQQETINHEIERYLNRVSDYLFVLARVAAHRDGVEEITWTRT
jgi:cob(I)alamin adenosyltransferase